MRRYNGRGYRDDSFSLDTEDDIRAIEEIQRVLQKEIFYRAVVRYWRIFHILLAVVTVGVTLWHIEYAFALIIPAVQKYGITYLFPWP
jgi:hypothetical protein